MGIKMRIETHPEQLSRANLEIWRKDFVKKLKRTTTRTDQDRLILAIDRREFEDWTMAEWTEVIFGNEKGKVSYTDKYGDFESEEFNLSDFERKILAKNENLRNQKIEKSSLKAEDGDWNLKGISSCLEYAVRVTCFDSALFTGDTMDYSYEWHLSEEFKVAENEKTTGAIPHHDNVIKNFANCEIKQYGEVVGWITIMEYCESNLRKFLKREEKITIKERKRM